MDRVIESLNLAERAVATLEEAVALQPSVLVRDAALQRFEYTFEATWKAAKRLLLEREGLDVASPKGVVRSCHEVGLLDEMESLRALEMADDRNLTSHTYNEGLADLIFQRLPGHTELLRAWLSRMTERAGRRAPEPPTALGGKTS